MVFAAVSYAAKGAEKPALGSLKIEADTKVAMSDRLVKFTGLKTTEANFPTLPKDQVREVVAEIEKAIPDEERVIALDRVLASLDKSQIIPKNVEGVKADPPTIFYSETPAVLVNLDGEPIWSPIKDNDLKYAVNTNWDLFQHGQTKEFYLRHNESWLEATDLKGAWQPAGKLPESFSKLPADDNWKEVRAALPGKALPGNRMPTIFVSQTPAEMILLTGPPSYVTVGNTKLLWINNTESDVFRLGRTGPVYYLVAGRWFSAPDFRGPWTFSTTSLPPEFQQIPLEHQRSRVLASVPGTQQAAEAVLLAQVPQTARVNKKEIAAPAVAYQGDPKFDADPGHVGRPGGEYRQGHHQGWRPLLPVLPGRVVHVEGPDRPVGGRDGGPEGDLRDPVQFAGSQRHLRDGRGRRRQRRLGDVRGGGRLHGHDGRLGLRGVGHGLVLPAVLGLWWLLPVLLPALSDVRLRRLVQPLEWRVRAFGGGVRALRRGRRHGAVQPDDRDVLPWRGRVGTVRRAWRRRGLQPPHGDLRADATGLGRLRQLGLDGRSARRRLGADVSRDESADGHDDAGDAGVRGRGGHHAPRLGGQWRRGADGQRRRVCRQRRQRLSQGGRLLAEVQTMAAGAT